MSDLTAIDILVNPDEATVTRAREVNARMLKSMPQGWVLDDTHQPHITTLQRYVCTAELDQVYEAVATTIADTDMASLSYQVVKITHADWGFPGYGPAVLLVQVSPEVLDFQSALVTAVTPFVEPGGAASAFVTRRDQPDHREMGRGVRAGPDRRGQLPSPPDGRRRHLRRPESHRGRTLRLVRRPPRGRRHLPPRQQRDRTRRAEILAALATPTAARNPTRS
jgi:hypothetical protein